MHDGGALLGVQPVEQRGGIDRRAGLAAPVVPVPGWRGRVVDVLEESLRHLFGRVVLGGRRGPSSAGWRPVRKLSSKRLLIASRV